MTARLPLESLRVFEACARHGNFTRAAAELAVTGTAVSQRIRSLEMELGVVLFRRHGPRVTLTDAGQLLSARVRDALTGLHKAVSDCSALHAPLRVTCTPTFANRWLVPRLPNFQRTPGAGPIQIDISKEERSPETFDVAIKCGTGPWPGLEGIPLLPLEGTPMLVPGLAARLTDDPSSLAELPLIPDERWFDWFALARVKEPRPAFLATEYPSQDVVAISALNGDGGALLSPRLFQEELRTGALVAPFPITLQGPASYWMLWHAHRPASSFIGWMSEQIRAEARTPARPQVDRRVRAGG
jgi:LysR family glycine cleavage system transcriptional activator